MSRWSGSSRIRVTAAARAAWAGALLVAPERILTAAAGRAPVPAGAVAAARVLGARHLLQAAAGALAATSSAAGLGALVDTVHTASCAALAAVSPRWCRVALADAVIEAGFAVAGWTTAGRLRHEPR